MTKTENYQLNQWDPEDPIRRTDFNEDNEKTDAAIHELEVRKSEFVKLLEVNVNPLGNVSSYSVDVSGIDFGAWQFVLLDAQVNGFGNYSLCANSIGFKFLENMTAHSSPQYARRVTLLTCKRSDWAIAAVSQNLYGRNDTYTWESFNTLVIRADDGYHISAGGLLTFWGVA